MTLSKRNIGLIIGVLGTMGLVAYFAANYQITPLADRTDSVAVGGQTRPSANAGAQANVDPMADHHGKPQAADSSVFQGLVGKAAPDFTAETFDSAALSLNSLRGKKVILFFNEGLMCYPACWNQIAAFANPKEFDRTNTVVINIVTDSKTDWEKAIKKMPELAGATVVFDPKRTISSAYGVLNLPSSMHRGQFPGHSYVIIDAKGIVQFVKDDVQMAIRNKELADELVKL